MLVLFGPWELTRNEPSALHPHNRPLRAQALAGGFATLRRSPLRFEPSLRSPIRVHEAREVIAAYADTDRAATRRHSQSRSVGRADFDYVISRLAPIGEKMAILLA